MRPVCYSAAISLDGYIAGPNGEADWIVMDPDIDFKELFARFDTALLGRMMILAPQLALQEGCNPYPDGGFRILSNTGAEGRQEVHHLHIHVMGGPRPWLRG